MTTLSATPTVGGAITLPVRLATAVAAVVALLVSVLLSQLRPDEPGLAGLAAFAAWAVIAGPVLLGAWRGLIHVRAELNPYYLDLFVALVLLGCLATGRYATGAIVAIVLVVGQLVEERSVRGMREAIDGLSRLSRVPARRLREGREETTDAESIAAGDRLRVLPGEVIPADGCVQGGESAVDQSPVTGEALPVDVAPGSDVFAGTLNLSGVLEVEVNRAAADTVLGKVRAILETAEQEKPLLTRRLDTYLRYYTPAVLLVTGLTWIVTRDVNRAIAMLVVCLPCAFVLSGPAVMVAALAVCSRLGILVKTLRHFETANALDTVVFDKTGTLTRGRLIITAIERLDTADRPDVLPLVQRLAAASQHPVAQAIAGSAPGDQDAGAFAQEVREVPGRGLAGTVDGRHVLLGSAAWLAVHGVPLQESAESGPERRVFAAIDGHAVLGFRLADELRVEAPGVVEDLRRLGVDDAVVLTGDHPEAAAAVAQQAGISRYIAHCLPEQKLSEVRRLRTAGRSVLVVGDGVNDAPALAAANLSMAISHSSAHIAVQTADVAILGQNLDRVVHFLRISQRALGLMQQNLVVASVLIAIALVLAALGVIGPLAGALLHEASAFFVLLNAARLLRYDG